MRLTTDEHRALSFIAALLCLSAVVRFLALPEPVDVPEAGGFDLGAHIEAVEAAVAEAEARERPLEPGERIDPNTASAAQLDRLPRVGPALAARILADREENGRYRTLADLDRVPGIGARTLEMLRPHIALREGPFGADARSPGTARVRGSGPGRGRSGGAGDGAPVDLNRATAEELTRLPGIGPVLAARIVAYRDSAGPFATVEALGAVQGIGPATLARVAEKVLVR